MYRLNLKKIRPLTDNEIHFMNNAVQIDELNQKSKSIKGGAYYDDVIEMLSTTHQQLNQLEKELNNNYIHKIYQVISRYDRIPHDERREGYATFKTDILNDEGRALGELKIQAVETPDIGKVIIGIYNKKNNNYTHISFFKNSFIHLTFIFINNVTGEERKFHLYYKFMPNDTDNWQFLLNLIQDVQNLLFTNRPPLINSNIHKDGHYFWSDKWQDFLFNDDIPLEITESNKRFIYKQFLLLNSGIQSLINTPELSLIPIVHRPVSLVSAAAARRELGKRKLKSSPSPPKVLKSKATIAKETVLIPSPKRNITDRLTLQKK